MNPIIRITSKFLCIYLRHQIPTHLSILAKQSWIEGKFINSQQQQKRWEEEDSLTIGKSVLWYASYVVCHMRKMAHRSALEIHLLILNNSMKMPCGKWNHLFLRRKRKTYHSFVFFFWLKINLMWNKARKITKVSHSTFVLHMLGYMLSIYICIPHNLLSNTCTIWLNASKIIR